MKKRNQIVLIGAITAIAVALIFVVNVAAQAPQASPTPQATPNSVLPNNGLPAWAYNVPEKVQPAVEERKGPVHLPGSSKEYDASETESGTHPPDWFPDEHGPAPKIVTGTPGSNVAACGSCHLMSGQGHPESTDIAGMPAEYLIRQMAYFKSGARKDPARMNIISKATSEEDARAAAEYFAASKPIPWVKVIESETAPKTYVSNRGRTRLLAPDGGTEPIGHRIIEVPQDAFRTLSRDPHSPFSAYVPTGSIAKGEALVKSGGSGKTIQCALCHGEGLHGLGEVPRIAGLQPVYIARQLMDIQNGTSGGKAVALMKNVVAKLSEDEIISISSYVGTLPPQ
jgi:cytochrome c553